MVIIMHMRVHRHVLITSAGSGSFPVFEVDFICGSVKYPIPKELGKSEYAIGPSVDSAVI